MICKSCLSIVLSLFAIHFELIIPVFAFLTIFHRYLSNIIKARIYSILFETVVIFNISINIIRKQTRITATTRIMKYDEE